MPLQVVCPTVPGGLNEATRAALDRHAPGWMAEDVSASPTAYWSLLRALWAQRQGFVLVEQDIEIRSDVIPAFEHWPAFWCAFGYPCSSSGSEADLVFASLGCTRFSADLLEVTPGLLDADSADPAVLDWRRLDCLVSHRLRQAGYTVHVHRPAVAHHHVYQGRCACGNPHR